MKKWLACLLTLGAAVSAEAGDFMTVDSPAVLYDAPSQKGSRLFVIRRDTPVEIVVGLDGWAKVRDADGGLAWIERKNLSARRSVMVTATKAEIRQAADEGASLVFSAEKSVALDFVETLPAGWIKVRHRDGATGFVRANQVWGY